MPDNRTKRQKVQALYDAAATPGEKAAAKAALDRMGPEPAEARARHRGRPGTIYWDHRSASQMRREEASFREQMESMQDTFEAFSRAFNTDWTCEHRAVKGLCQICNPAPNQKPFKHCKHGEPMGADDEYAEKCKPCFLEKQAGYRAPKGSEAEPAGRQASQKKLEERDLVNDWISGGHNSFSERLRADGLVTGLRNGKITYNDLRKALGKEPI